jgi:hypothetical protein
MMTGAEVPARSEQEWADIIRADLGQALGGIIAAGRHLIQARCQLGRGRFGDMLRIVRMHERTAERLMRIAESPVLTSPDYAAHLPTSMRTLAELTRFPSPILEGYLQNGTINVATERADVEKLLKVPKPTHGSAPELSQPAESWAQSKPPAEAMEAAMARNAEQEAEALAEEIETNVRCSFCDESDTDLVCNASREAFICLECSVAVQALLASSREEIPALGSNAVIEPPPTATGWRQYQYWTNCSTPAPDVDLRATDPDHPVLVKWRADNPKSWVWRRREPTEKRAPPWLHPDGSKVRPYNLSDEKDRRRYLRDHPGESIPEFPWGRPKRSRKKKRARQQSDELWW